MDSLIRDMIRQEGIAEQMKSDDPLLWTARKNSIRDRAEEMVMDEIIRALWSVRRSDPEPVPGRMEVKPFCPVRPSTKSRHMAGIFLKK